MNRVAILIAALAAIALPELAAPSSASAQGCADSDAAFCASVDIRIGGGRRQRVRQAPPPPPPPRQGVVIVQPAPPPPPPRQVVVVPQHRPQRVMVVQQAPAQPMYRVPVRRAPQQRHRRFGWHGRVAGMFGNNASLGGFHTGLRIRPVPHFAIDLGIGAYGGTDYNGADRVEVPLTVDALFYLNPRRRFQVYLLAGVGTSFASTDGYIPATGDYGSRTFRYAGAEIGIGLEFRITQGFALSTDFRAFARTRIGGDGIPEYVNEATGEIANSSIGALGSFGATVYW